MTDEDTVDRRTVIKTATAGIAASLGVSTAAAATAQSEQEPAQQADSLREPDRLDSRRTGIYSGTVDRIVDGTHVVILLEEGGRVQDQYVVRSDEYPGLSEGDSVSLFVLRGRLLSVW